MLTSVSSLAANYHASVPGAEVWKNTTRKSKCKDSMPLKSFMALKVPWEVCVPIQWCASESVHAGQISQRCRSRSGRLSVLMGDHGSTAADGVGVLAIKAGTKEKEEVKCKQEIIKSEAYSVLVQNVDKPNNIEKVAKKSDKKEKSRDTDAKRNKENATGKTDKESKEIKEKKSKEKKGHKKIKEEGKKNIEEKLVKEKEKRKKTKKEKRDDKEIVEVEKLKEIEVTETQDTVKVGDSAAPDSLHKTADRIEGRFFDRGMLEPNTVKAANFAQDSRWHQQIGEENVKDDDDELFEGDEEVDYEGESSLPTLAEEFMKAFPFYSGVEDVPELNAEHYETREEPLLSPREEERMEAAFAAMQALCDFLPGPLHEPGLGSALNIFDLQCQHTQSSPSSASSSPTVPQPGRVSPNVRVEDPSGVIVGAESYWQWLEFQGRHGVVMNLEEIYLETKPEDDNHQWIHTYWHLNLAQNLEASLRSWNAWEWWQDKLPSAIENLRTQLPEDSELPKEFVQDAREESGVGLNLRGHSCFTMDRSGQISHIMSDWFLLEGTHGFSNLAEAHLFMKFLKQKSLLRKDHS